MATVKMKAYEMHNAPERVGPHLIMVAAIFALIISLAAALPGRTALDAQGAPIRSVSAACHSSECLSPAQIISAKEGFRMKTWMGDHALLVDIRDPAEIPAGLTFGADAQIPFLDASASNGNGNGNGHAHSEMEFRINFAMGVDDALRARHMKHEEPVILMGPSSETTVLAALLLQEHGYSRVFVMHD